MVDLIRSYVWILLVIFISLLGLGIMQYVWVKKAHSIKEEELRLSLTNKLSEVAAQWRLDNDWSAAFTRLDSVNEERTFRLVSQVSGYLDSTFREAGVADSVWFAIYEGSQKNILISNAENYSVELTESPLRVCLTCMVRISFPGKDTLQKGISGNLEPFILEHSEDQIVRRFQRSSERIQYLALFIPGLSDQAKSGIGRIWLLTLVLIFLLAGSLLYMVFLLLRQKKISGLKDDFINHLSHELKTPVSSLLMAARTLRLFPHDEREQSYIHLIEEEGRRLEAQIDRVLYLAMVDAENFRLDKVEVDVSELVCSTAARLRVQAEQAGGEIEIEDFDTEIIIRADELHFGNAIYNLIDNALKYGGNPPRVHIRMEKQEQLVRISVSDNGEGIPEDMMDRVFHKFYQARNSSGKGFGLGLTYVHSIAKQHKGSVAVKNPARGGTCFTLSLPA